MKQGVRYLIFRVCMRERACYCIYFELADFHEYRVQFHCVSDRIQLMYVDIFLRLFCLKCKLRTLYVSVFQFYEDNRLTIVGRYMYSFIIRVLF
jgi:hypothetical protein